MNEFSKMVSNFVNTTKYPHGLRAMSNIIENTSFVNAMKQENNWGYTTNGAVGKKSTGSKLYDLFAIGAAYRQRSEADCILLFKNAYLEDKTYALKCLAYLRDIESQGQGERRFFRVILKWLVNFDEQAIKRNLQYLVKNNYCRWDDIFVLFDTKLESFAMDLIRSQLTEDIKNYKQGNNVPISLCAKWCSSCNASSSQTKREGRKIATALGLTEREYRKMLSMLRERIKVVERLMSQNRWNEIQFDKLPSRAGLLYRNCFKNKGLIAEKYRQFATNSNTTVNAGKLYPYDIAAKAIKLMGSNGYGRHYVALDDTERLMINKYWENLEDFFKDAVSNLMVVADTSGSMTWSGDNSVKPIDVATSLAVYAAEHAKGPFANHYISFSRTARLIEVEGVDFCDKIDRIVRKNLCENTNLESVFDLVLNTAMNYRLTPSQIPSTLVIITDMQVDVASNSRDRITFMESMRHKWYQKCGGKYNFPNLVLWNVNASSNINIIDDSKTGVTYVSGCSPTIFTQVLTGVTGEKLMYQVLDSERYKNIK